MAKDFVTFTVADDHTDEVLEETGIAILRALEAVGLAAEGYAKRLCPVDTGRLRNSITHAIAGEAPAVKKYAPNAVHASTKATKKVGTAGQPVEDTSEGEYEGVTPREKNTVYIGTNVVYAPYVETGSSRGKKQPFLKPAIQNNMDEYKKIFQRYLGGKA
jgi:HK97 gp10 family phage protein